MLSPALRRGPVALTAVRTIATTTTISNSNDNYNIFSTPILFPPSALRRTRILLRPQTVKPNPFATESGKFDQSFEKMVGSLERKLPFRQHHLKKGYIYDRNFGEENMDQMKEAAREDLEGREPESMAARQARSYFTGEDLSPEAMHVKSPKLKVAQQIQRQRYDRRILKTTDEPAEYYYPQLSLKEKQQRTFFYWGCVGMATVVVLLLWRRLSAYMRIDSDPITIDSEGNVQKLIRS